MSVNPATNRHKIDESITRKAHAHAFRALKAAHVEEYADLVDEGYDALGVESPRMRALRRKAEAAEKRAVAAAAREAREQRKIDEARAFLASKGVQTPLA